MLHDSLKKASLSSRTERPPNNMYLISATECLKAIHHSVVHLAGHSKLRRTGEMRLLASVPVNAASPWKGCCHKSVNQFDFEVTKPRRVIVGNVRYCISRNLIRVAMFHFCYLFEGLTFPLCLEPLLLAVRDLILRCPQKVAVSRMTIGRLR